MKEGFPALKLIIKPRFQNEESFLLYPEGKVQSYIRFIGEKPSLQSYLNLIKNNESLGLSLKEQTDGTMVLTVLPNNDKDLESLQECFPEIHERYLEEVKKQEYQKGIQERFNETVISLNSKVDKFLKNSQDDFSFRKNSNQKKEILDAIKRTQDAIRQKCDEFPALKHEANLMLQKLEAAEQKIYDFIPSQPIAANYPVSIEVSYDSNSIFAKLAKLQGLTPVEYEAILKKNGDMGFSVEKTQTGSRCQGERI